MLFVLFSQLRSMELLLNLAWMLLALPAYWLWRRDAGSRAQRRSGSIESFLALACVLVLLFPVISATDDLHAMRAEMEDTAISKRAVRQASSERASAWINRLQASPAVVTHAFSLAVPRNGLFEKSFARVSPSSARGFFLGDRAPPVFRLQ